MAQQGFASPGKAPLKVSDDKLQPAWSAALHELAGKPQHLGPGHLSSWVTRDRSLHRSLATPCSLQRPFKTLRTVGQDPSLSRASLATRRVMGPCSPPQPPDTALIIIYRLCSRPVACNQSFSKAPHSLEEDLNPSCRLSNSLSGH